ncbi:ATP-dependent RNA helicase dbp6 [Fusarium albosuccineum]|uniref:ATP-dependent RNA helicase n=1 Tax=Fusarium albosuccineum TaxID=1237068 RepID=A0A8H4PCS0_9HYPO|nr:ATP-dependent RNA helicase dbp6 [Fusarium albosuccineum]
MYARYVPPAKGGKPSNSAPPVSTPTSAVKASPATDGFSYSRYVPGAKPTPKPVETPQVQYFDEEPSPLKAKRKRDSGEEPHDSPQPGSKKSKTGLEATETAQNDTEEAPKKKKKVRRGKKRTGASKDDDDEAAPDTLKTKTESQKAEVQEKTGDISEAQEESQTLDEDSQQNKKKEKKKKEKREKKKKKETQEPEQVDQVAPGAEEENEDVSMIDTAAPVEEEAVPEPVNDMEGTEDKKQKKREKEKKKKHKEPEPTGDEEDEEDNQRHKAVLERLEKSLKLAGEVTQDVEDDTDQGELHGLEPLPQPEPISLTTSKPSYETLPSWLAEPIRVSQDTRTPFSELGILPKASRVLEERGFRDAFAVQTAAIPLLLPTSTQRPGDVLISAATGSGKTLAYALPVVRDISQGAVTRLRALVVLPTRELVKQAQEAFELCAKAFEGGERKRVRVGISIGSQSLKYEQEVLMDREVRYDPDTYKKLQEENQRRRQQQSGLSTIDDFDDLDEDADPRLSSMDGYVVDFPSKVDVLICTPGRLVEHMEQTPGFSLDYVRWLVVDEADKLLAQSFQGWLDLAMERFRVNKFSARDFPDMDFSGVRKVILSATLTRDLSLLNHLGLRRPRLVVLESDGDVQIAEHSLPALLKEHAVRVHDTNLKPLYLLELLQGQHMLMASPRKDETSPVADEDETSDSSSDSSSDPSSDSDSGSDATSDTSSDSDSDSESKSKPSSVRSLKSNIPISLIFTKSNESALRLSRLLALLDPSLASHIGTLTSTTPTHIRRKTLRAFTTPSSPIRLLIASDLVARGIDLPNLDHVINYDLPPSVAGYVHRVGRTARAGRSGCAWTLVGDDESGWFWGKIAKGSGVRRAQKVERTRIEEMGEERVEEYEAALEKLGKEAGR